MAITIPYVFSASHCIHQRKIGYASKQRTPNYLMCGIQKGKGCLYFHFLTWAFANQPLQTEIYILTFACKEMYKGRKFPRHASLWNLVFNHVFKLIKLVSCSFLFPFSISCCYTQHALHCADLVHNTK